MKNVKTRFFSLLLALTLCFPTVLTAVASESDTGARVAQTAEKNESTLTYDDLYVRDADGDGDDDSTFMWDAFRKRTIMAVSESAFGVKDSARYGNGYLFNDGGEIDLTKYLPNFTYGTQTAQKDFTVELVTSMNAPESGTGYAYSTWYIGNATLGVNFRQSEHVNISDGPMGAWMSFSAFAANVTSSGSGVDFNKTYSSNGDGKPFFGKIPLEIYSNAFAVTFGLGNAPDKTKDTIRIKLYRDSAEFYVSALDREFLYDASNTNDYLKFGANCPLNYYAMRVYSVALTEAQIRQNHFADLAKFIQIDNLSVFSRLTDESKQQLYSQFASTALPTGKTADLKEEIELAIAGAYALQSEITASDFVSFLGFQVRLYGESPALRATFIVNESEQTDATLVEVGTVAAKANKKYALNDLTPEKASADANLIAQTVYANGAWDESLLFKKTVGGEEKTCFASVYSYGEQASDKDFTADMLFRAYVKVDIGGALVTLYTDMTSSLAHVSLALVSEKAQEKREDEEDAALISQVLDSKFGKISTEMSALEKKLAGMVDERLAAIAGMETARNRAYELKEALKAIVAEGADANEAEKQELISRVNTLLADVSDIKAQANTAFPVKNVAMVTLTRDAKALDTRIQEADGANDLCARIAELLLAIETEKALQSAGYPTSALLDQEDAKGALTAIEKIGARLKGGDFSPVKSLKLLSIGNSWSVNALSQFYEIAEDFGYEEIVIGIIYRSGCTIERHVEFIKNNTLYESYRKNTSGAFVVYKESFNFLECLKDEAWDIITIQQGSVAAGNVSSLTDGNLDYLIEYVNAHKLNQNAKIYYHATWSFAEGNGHSSNSKPGYEYMNNAAQMDSMIADCVASAIVPRTDIDGVIYAGVAIAEARKHFGNKFELYKSVITDGVQTDGYHLNAKGCYIVSLTWMGTLMGEDISNAKATSSCELSGDNLAAAINAAKVGVSAGAQ